MIRSLLHVTELLAALEGTCDPIETSLPPLWYNKTGTSYIDIYVHLCTFTQNLLDILRYTIYSVLITGSSPVLNKYLPKMNQTQFTAPFQI